MINSIYKQVSGLDFNEVDKRGRYLYKDGSASREMIDWTLQQLGFIDTNDYRFEGYIERGWIHEEVKAWGDSFKEVLNVVPEKLITKEGYIFFLQPLEEKGKFNIKFFRIWKEGENSSLNLPDVHITQLSYYLPYAIEASNSLYKKLLKDYMYIEDRVPDNRFTRSKEGWRFKGLLIEEDIQAFFATNHKDNLYSRYIKVEYPQVDINSYGYYK